jgi:hypothetical protein
MKHNRNTVNFFVFFQNPGVFDVRSASKTLFLR